MLVSVIVNTKNEEKNIRKCLDSILAQAYPRDLLEIIVVDNNSSDKTKDIVRKFQSGLAPLNLKVFNRGPERSAQKNFGVRESSGEYFLHLDADMRLSRDIVSECARKVSGNSDIVALHIPEKIIGRGFWGKVRNFERSFYNGTVVDGVRFVNKEKFLEVGGFDERLYACEDWDLDKRLKKSGKFGITKNYLFHDETDFNLAKYLAKKKYYAKNFDTYISKWGKDDADIRKQFGFYYRFIGVFMGNGKWRKALRHPILVAGVLVLRFFVGLAFITGRKSAIHE
jgi:glycosyltransferase involved in cell wall biosynthesis